MLRDGPREMAQDATRYEILRHAEDLFSHYGFSKTSMADIAGRAGMSPANLYRYFRNKTAIGLAVAEAFFRGAEAEIQAALMGVEGPEARIRAVMKASVVGIVRHMDCTPKIMDLVQFLLEEDEAWAVLQRHIGWKRMVVEVELTKGIEAGLFRDVDVYPTAVNLMHATKAFQLPQSLAAWRDRETILPELDGVLDLLFQGVRAR